MAVATLLLAGAYEEPVFTWLHFRALESDGCPSGNNFGTLVDLLFRGESRARSPQEAGWPLHKHFERAGIAVMRRSWEGDTSVVVARCGWGGSHYQPCQGTVVFVGQGYPVLAKMGKHPRSGYSGNPSKPGYLYTHGHFSNNIIIVDGQSERSLYPSLGKQQRKLGEMRQLGPYAYEMDPSSRYQHIVEGFQWKRVVRYDPGRDLVIIEDTIDTGDKPRDIVFNWVTDGKVVSDGLYDMPGPYWMAARLLTPGQMKSKNVTHFDYWPTIQAAVKAKEVSVRWAVGPDRSLVEKAAGEDQSGLGLTE